MTTLENQIPEAIQRAVGFELTAQGFQALGDDWADFAQQYQGFADSIYTSILSDGMDEQFCDNARSTLLKEREESTYSWLQVDFFPSISEDKNSTSTTDSSTNSANLIDSEYESASFSMGGVSALNHEAQELEKKESEAKENEIEESEEIEIKDVDETKNIEDDPLQQDLVRRAVPILFKALEQYGTVSESGQSIVLEGERNLIRWSIPHRKLTVEGEEQLDIEFDKSKKVNSIQSHLSSDYVEHLENQVASQLQSTAPTRIITKNVDR